jgi:hypothetical protein
MATDRSHYQQKEQAIAPIQPYKAPASAIAPLKPCPPMSSLGLCELAIVLCIDHLAVRRDRL